MAQGCEKYTMTAQSEQRLVGLKSTSGAGTGSIVLMVIVGDTIVLFRYFS
jgi:hypothetical protein